MIGLLYKELLFLKNEMKWILIGIVLVTIPFFIPMIEVTDATSSLELSIISLLMICCSFILFLMVGSVQVSSLSYDESKKWANFIASSPLTHKSHVLAKYLSSLIYSLIIYTYCIILLQVNAVVMESSPISSAILFAFILVQIAVRSIEFPFLFRFGSKNGNNFRIALFLLLFFIAIIYALFGDLSVFGTMEGFMDWYLSFVASPKFSDFTSVLVAIAPIFVGALYYLSYKLSCRFYLKGVDNYDR